MQQPNLKHRNKKDRENLKHQIQKSKRQIIESQIQRGRDTDNKAGREKQNIKIQGEKL